MNCEYELALRERENGVVGRKVEDDTLLFSIHLSRHSLTNTHTCKSVGSGKFGNFDEIIKIYRKTGARLLQYFHDGAEIRNESCRLITSLHHRMCVCVYIFEFTAAIFAGNLA